MQSKYPFILAHGIVLKDFKFFKAFGRIEKKLKNAGYSVYTAKTDGFGTIENNAEQLKKHIREILIKEGCDKVNIIAHSKGGLDAAYMIKELDMVCSVASLTTLCTPYKGSQIASLLLTLPKPVTSFMAFWVNGFYRIFGDKKPNSLQVCKQLKKCTADGENLLGVSNGVYCQSFSATMAKSRDDFIMGIPLMFNKRFDAGASDGMVTADSSKFGNYRGDCVDGSVSHLQIAGFSASKKKREKIYAFYLQLCSELSQMGF